MESLIVEVPREVALKVKIGFNKNKCKKMLLGSLNLGIPPSTPDNIHLMPNAHSPDKEPLSLQIPRTLMGRLIAKAQEKNVSVPEYVTSELTLATNDTVLKSEDYIAIAKATEEAERTGRRLATQFAGSKRAKRKTP